MYTEVHVRVGWFVGITSNTTRRTDTNYT